MTLVEERFGISPELTFTSDDLDKDVYENLVKEVEEKSKQFFNSEVSRRGRTLEHIRRNTWDGMVAEKFLIQKLDLIDDKGKWRDLKNSKYRLEVKTFATPEMKYEIILKLEKRKTKYDHVVMFYRQGNSYKTDSYYTYNWETEKYELQENFGPF